MQITLTPEAEEAVKAAVAEGGYGSADACVHSVIREQLGDMCHADPQRHRPRVLTPRLFDPAQAEDFVMNVMLEASDVEL